MQGKKKEARQRTFSVIYLLIHLRNGADAGGRGVKQLAAGAVNRGSSVKDRDRGAMTGKFYRAKNAGGTEGGKQRKEETNREKNYAIRTNETEGNGKAENAAWTEKKTKTGRKRQEKGFWGRGKRENE